MSKEEAIEILNGDIKGYYISQKQNGISEKYEIALETVLNYIKELEKGITRLKDKNKKLSEEIIDVKVDKVKRNFIPKQEHKEKIKELEKERDGIYADYQDLGKAYYDSIPKQVIRDKIEELKKHLKDVDYHDIEDSEERKFYKKEYMQTFMQIQVLKELLEEG